MTKTGMTKTEAIKLLVCEKVCVEDVDGNIGGEGVRQAYDMAIEALSADAVSREFYDEALKANHGLAKENCELKEQIESAEPSGDLISRADAIKAVSEAVAYGEGFIDVLKALESLPSAEAVHGEWVRKYDDKVNCYWYECDQCGEYRPRNQFGKEYNANFCPNCGAKMGGDD